MQYLYGTPQPRQAAAGGTEFEIHKAPITGNVVSRMVLIPRFRKRQRKAMNTIFIVNTTDSPGKR
jgi:hypothetical protein